MSRLTRIGHGLYEGRMSIDFVGRKWLWYAISGLIVLVAILGLTVKGLNYGIEFKGGVEYAVSMPPGQANQQSVDAISKAVQESGVDAAANPIVTTSGADNIRVQTEPLDNNQVVQVSNAIEKAAGVSDNDVSQQSIGPSWGAQVAQRALTGLIVFIVLVMLLIWGYFREWKMSVAAIVALAHDLLITIGVYALSGFEVTPATVTGILTILGFSLYDTVVVFDKVRENTKRLGSTHETYAEAANRAVNQTLVRSINTSVVALLPVGALLYVGQFVLGSGALKDLALALFVGMAAGAYSSIFIATPLLVQLKEREPGIKAGDARALRHKSRRDADRFAHVPAYADDMPVQDDPGEEPSGRPSGATAADAVPPAGNRPVRPGAPGRVTAGERTTASRPVSDRTSAGRPQPTRKPRSQRGKS